MTSAVDRNHHHDWHHVELRHLDALVAIGKLRSFSAAADHLGYVQSAVSRQLATLEELTGLRLVDRVRGVGPISLTEAGGVLASHAEEILGQLGTAHEALERLESGDPHAVSVGLSATVAPRLAPVLMSLLADRWPELEVTRLATGGDGELVHELHAGRLDAAFVDLACTGAGLASRELLAEPLVLIVPASSRLAAREAPLRAEDLARVPLIRHGGSPQIEAIERELGPRDRTPWRVRAGTLEAVQALVAAGLGVAVMPRMAVDHDPRIAAVALAGQPVRTLGLAWSAQGLRPGALKVREAVREACADVGGVDALDAHLPTMRFLDGGRLARDRRGNPDT
jgi:LysR family transcriptional regulator, hydrogen peroxide-inducible genes activator